MPSISLSPSLRCNVPRSMGLSLIVSESLIVLTALFILRTWYPFSDSTVRRVLLTQLQIFSTTSCHAAWLIPHHVL